MYLLYFLHFQSQPHAVVDLLLKMALVVVYATLDDYFDVLLPSDQRDDSAVVWILFGEKEFPRQSFQCIVESMDGLEFL